VLRGGMGVGKTIVGKIFGSLLGPHYASVSDPRFVTGQFNAHMKQVLLLHADEAFWAGDKRAEGRLKDLVTGDEHFIEFKGIDPIKMKNYVRLFVTGNPDWQVPAGFGERRFAVVDVGEAHKEDRGYFEALAKQLEEGGREALLWHLLHFDLSRVDVHVIPKTKALLEQQIETMDAEQSWWFEMLRNGELPCRERDEPSVCLTSALFARYNEHARQVGVSRRSTEVKVGMFLRKRVPGLKSRQEADGRRAYAFPPLKQCREAFAQALGNDVDWGADGEWRRSDLPF